MNDFDQKDRGHFLVWFVMSLFFNAALICVSIYQAEQIAYHKRAFAQIAKDMSINYELCKEIF